MAEDILTFRLHTFSGRKAKLTLKTGEVLTGDYACHGNTVRILTKGSALDDFDWNEVREMTIADIEEADFSNIWGEFSSI